MNRKKEQTCKGAVFIGRRGRFDGNRAVVFNGGGLMGRVGNIMC